MKQIFLWGCAQGEGLLRCDQDGASACEWDVDPVGLKDTCPGQGWSSRTVLSRCMSKNSTFVVQLRDEQAFLGRSGGP